MDVTMQNTVRPLKPISDAPAPRPVSKVSVEKAYQNTVQANAVQANAVQQAIHGNASAENFLSVSDRAVVAAIEHINKVVKGADIQLDISVHKATNTVMVKMVNADTKEIIRELPPEKILDMVAERMKIYGLYVDERR